jgi:predicted metal-binding protein
MAGGDLMSVLGCITVHECDHCKTIVTLSSDDQYQAFEDTWWTSCRLDFCPVCRHLNLPEIIEAVEEELVMQRAIKRAVRKYGVGGYSSAT